MTSLLAALCLAFLVASGESKEDMLPIGSLPESQALAGELDIVDVDATGREVRIHVDELEELSGRRGFLRSPLLQGMRARGLQVWIEGELVVQRDEVFLPRLGRRPADAALDDFDGLLTALLDVAR